MSGPPDRYAVVGNPVAHSQSPFIHAEFARQTGEDLVYDRRLCPLDGFARAVQEFAAGGARGCNVTMPFKLEALALVARPSGRAALAGACNVVRFDADGGWAGDNTDGVGLVRDIEGNVGVALRGLRVLVVGAGGAAAGVLGPICAAGAAEVVVANRTVERARELVRRQQAIAPPSLVAARATALDGCGERFDVVINATSSSVAGAAPPVPPHALARGGLAIDLMYGPPAGTFLRWAERLGAQGRDGLGMLVEQAAEAFAFWRGVRPQTAPVLAALRRRLAEA